MLNVGPRKFVSGFIDFKRVDTSLGVKRTFGFKLHSLGAGHGLLQDDFKIGPQTLPLPPCKFRVGQ